MAATSAAWRAPMRIARSSGGRGGAGNRTWRAYLSTSYIPPSTAAVHARDRIGKGPWFNAKGVLIAADLEPNCTAMATT